MFNLKNPILTHRTDKNHPCAPLEIPEFATVGDEFDRSVILVQMKVFESHDSLLSVGKFECWMFNFERGVQRVLYVYILSVLVAQLVERPPS